MRIAIKATPRQKEEWLLGATADDIAIIWVESGVPDADVYFDFLFDEQGPAFPGLKDKPVFVAAMYHALNELPSNASRINAWNGFLQQPVLEVVLRNDADGSMLEKLGRHYKNVPDVPGMIAPRTIAMIVNEAYFALGDEVSTKDEIDTAMKLGTNYPLGPFEWSRKIGLHHIYRLLKHLSESDQRYVPAPAMEQELKAIA